MEKYTDADAIVLIEGVEYALYKNGPLKRYPYMVDTSADRIPEGKQRSLLKTYLRQNGVDVELYAEELTHWWVRQAIKTAQRADRRIQVKSSIAKTPAPMLFQSKDLSSKEFLPITEENITRIHEQALADTRYGANFAIIHDTLKRFPYNTERELVAMKISLIDLTNSTNISRHINKISLSELTELILSISDFDIRVAQGDPELVSQLAKCNGRVNLFSFASKYCTYHNVDAYRRDDYSIFDSVVQDALPHYIPKLKRSNVAEWRTSYNYLAFSNCIGELLEKNNIHVPYRRRKFDHFLWYANRKK